MRSDLTGAAAGRRRGSSPAAAGSKQRLVSQQKPIWLVWRLVCGDFEWVPLESGLAFEMEMKRMVPSTKLFCDFSNNYQPSQILVNL